MRAAPGGSSWTLQPALSTASLPCGSLCHCLSCCSPGYLCSSSAAVFGWFSLPRGVGRAISSCRSSSVAVPWAGAPAWGSKQCLATGLALELNRAEGLQNTGEALPGACGVSGWRRAALEVFRVQGGKGEHVQGETSLAMLQLPPLHTGSIPSSVTPEGAGAAFFRCPLLTEYKGWKEAGTGALPPAKDGCRGQIWAVSADALQRSPHCRCSQGHVLHQRQNQSCGPCSSWHLPP